MKTPAIIATATIAGSIAFAAGQTSISKRSLSTLPQSNHGLASTVVAGSSLTITEGCAVGERLNWFIRAHRLPQCFAEQWGAASLLERGQYADIDGDGKDDHLIAMHYRDIGTGCTAVHSSYFEWGEGYNTCLVPPFQSYEFPVLWKPVFGVAGEVTVLTLRPVLTNQDVILLVTAEVALGNSGVNSFKMLGCFDVDGDGDLDLLIHADGLIYESSGQHQPFSNDFWLENNVVSTPPIAADLNHDGRVDGADLSLLLYAWGQTQ
jgi:hypothetical protein